MHKLRHRSIRMTGSTTAEPTSREILSSYPHTTASPTPQPEIGDSDSDTPGGSPQQAIQKRKQQSCDQTEEYSSSDNKPSTRPLELKLARSTDSDPCSDDSGPPPLKKSVAIDTSQNEHFTHRLLPVQSPEFDNVINQVCILNHCNS